MVTAVKLRDDYDSERLRALARVSKDASQVRRLLALATIYDGGSRNAAAAVCHVTPQVIRDWVLRFNAQGPEGLQDAMRPGQPSLLNDDHRAALRRRIEEGTTPEVDGVARWRIVDLCQWVSDEYRLSISETTMSREILKMGYRKLSTRWSPRQQKQATRECNKDSCSPGGYGPSKDVLPRLQSPLSPV